MANNWIANERQGKWTTEEQLKYITNKRIAESSPYESPEYKKANAENEAIRSKYGIERDEYNAEDAYKAFVHNSQSGNRYLSKADEVNFNVDDSGIKRAKKAVENFEFNAEESPEYQNYRERMQREADSATKQTINKLNSTNMGRNSSYSAAAAAQVQQAYASQLGAKAEELAERAYQRLLDKYNLEQAEYDRKYAKVSEEYGRNIDRANMDLNRWATVEQLDQGKEQHKQNMIASGYQNQMLGVDAEWYPKEKELDYQSGVKQGQILDAELEEMNLNNSMNYAGIRDAQNYLINNGLVDANGNCTVNFGGELRKISASEVAAGLYGQTMDIDDYGNLMYRGG